MADQDRCPEHGNEPAIWICQRSGDYFPHPQCPFDCDCDPVRYIRALHKKPAEKLRAPSGDASGVGDFAGDRPATGEHSCHAGCECQQTSDEAGRAPGGAGLDEARQSGEGTAAAGDDETTPSGSSARLCPSPDLPGEVLGRAVEAAAKAERDYGVQASKGQIDLPGWWQLSDRARENYREEARRCIAVVAPSLIEHGRQQEREQTDLLKTVIRAQQQTIDGYCEGEYVGRPGELEERDRIRSEVERLISGAAADRDTAPTHATTERCRGRIIGLNAVLAALDKEVDG